MYNSYNFKANDTSLISSEIINIIFEFKKYLLLQKISSGSLRSYLSDVRFFLNWLFNFLKEKHIDLTVDDRKLKIGIENRNLKIENLTSKFDLQPLPSTFNLPPSVLSFINEPVVEAYKNFLIKSNTPLKTINRRFSSLRKFGIFCQSQKWCSLLVFDRLKNIPAEEKPFPEDSYHLEEFRINLWKDRASKATIKNYLNDVKQFLVWTRDTRLI